MFNDINEIRLMGNITNEPELRFTPSGTAVLSFGMATNNRYKKNDEWVDEPTFHNIVVWAQQAQSLAPRVKKGTRVYVAGRVQNRSWEGTDGKKQYKSEVVASGVELIARYNEGTNSELAGSMPQPTRAAKGESKKPEASNDEPPFAKEELSEGIDVGASIDPDDLPF